MSTLLRRPSLVAILLVTVFYLIYQLAYGEHVAIINVIILVLAVSAGGVALYVLEKINRDLPYDF